MSDTAPGRYRIGIDIGGTFTDLVAIDEDGGTVFLKVITTPEDQSLGVMQGLAALATRLGCELPALLAATRRIVHGMTVGTNALLERKGAVVGLLTTAGHRDVLEMREGLKPHRYDVRMPRQDTLVPRHRRIGIRERVNARGEVVTPLDDISVVKAARHLADEGVNALAVCYLHSYAAPEHERRTHALVAANLPGIYISLSSEVLPRIKEFERVSTTVVNAYVGPLIQAYLTRLEHRIQDAGFTGNLLVILSHGGVAPVQEAGRLAAATVLSGPAGGLAGATRVAALSDAPDLISFDMGGTSTDIALVVDGEATLASERSIANERIALPSLDIITLGAGGGSLARVEAGALLRVGPESAGALPGPACYGQGGSGATVTDASVVLGYLDPAAPLAGDRALDADAAHAAVARVAERMGVDTTEAASGIHAVVNTHMAEGIRLATVRRGVDPRRFALLGFGGAAGLHVCALARALELSRILVPRAASVLSAWGMLATALRLESVRSHLEDIERLDPAMLKKVFAAMEADGTARMREWFDGEPTVQRFAQMRYGEQVYEIDVDLSGVPLDAADAVARIKTAFEQRHRELYTYALPEQDPVLVNLRIAVTGALPPPAVEHAEAQPGPAPVRDRRRIHLDGWLEVPVHDFDALEPGQTIQGPALVEGATTTVLLGHGEHAGVTGQRWLDIRLTHSA
jgi:N-methylhydantoinase A